MVQWFSANPCLPLWQGLNCTCGESNCFITHLNLSFYNLDGSIPNTIGNLQSLVHLILNGNKINGTIASSIGSIQDLVSLDLSNNLLKSSIPDTFYSLSNLHYLALQDNFINGTLSESIEQLEELEFLYLQRNFITGTIPSVLFNLTSLKGLNLGRNIIKGNIPNQLSSASTIQILDLSDNFLNGSIPSCVSNLRDLKYLSLALNKLTGSIPESIYECNNLTVLSLADNLLTGLLSANIVNLTQLLSLDLSFNSLLGTLPANIGNMTNIEELFLAHAQFVGSIPKSLWYSSTLRTLDLSENFLEGELSADLQYSLLENLLLNNISYHGTVPNELTNMRRLQVFSGYYNYFSGSIPAFNASNTRLMELDLAQNQLNGTIPESLYEVETLTAIDLSANGLSGSISKNIKKLSNLRSLDFSANQFSGSFPSTIGMVPVLFALNISNNRFNGTIPIELYNISNLAHIIADSNAFTGSIDSEVSSLSELVTFSFNYNNIVGSLPTVESNFEKLRLFEVAGNSLTGSIPIWLCSDFIRYVILDHNKLSQSIPPCLYSSTFIDELVLQHNLLTGSLPGIFSNSLTDLQLSSNALSGSLPNYLNDRIIAFQIYQNLLTGTLPPNLFEHGQYGQLSLDINYLTGSVPSSIANLTEINLLTFYTNLLDGVFPSIASLKTLSTFQINNNKFSGQLNIFNTEGESLLSTVDVSDNLFTGTLPWTLFRIPTIGAVAAVQNCITGSISDVICESKSLNALALDGLHTSPHCRQPLLGGNYALNYYTPGSIPSCLFAMSTLQSLHLTGNGIRGSLPYNMNVSRSLQNLSLSYNQLTGSIPFQLQTKPFNNFDLSYNNFNGVLLDSDVVISDNSSLYLRVNRLSGKIPSVFRDVKKISVLDGNIFQCQRNRDQLPKHDNQNPYYECGTTSLQDSMYLFVSIFASISSLLLCLMASRRFNCRPSKTLSTLVNQTMTNLQMWWKFINNDANDCENIELFNKLMDQCRKGITVLTGLMIFVFVPIYVVLSHFFRTYQNVYAWSVSSVYLAGLTPALICFVFYSLFCFSTFYLFYFIGRPHFPSDIGPLKSVSLVAYERYGHFLGLVGIAVVNFITVLGFNVMYVIASTTLNPDIVVVFQMILAIFKLIWNDSILRYLMSALHAYCATFYVLKEEEERLWSQRFLAFNTYTLLLNTIIIPCLATAIISTSCFYNTVVAPLSVVSGFSYSVCIELTGPVTLVEQLSDEFRANCTLAKTLSVSTSYLPPFIYRYQCSSTLVTTYTIVYVYKFVIAAFLQPLFNCAMIYASEHPDERFPRLNYFISVLVPHLKRRRYEHSAYMFTSDRLVLRLIMYFAVLVTFGVMFPPLAAMICIAVYIQTFETQLGFARFIFKREESERKIYLTYFNRDCANIGVMFKRTIHVIGGPAAFFYAFFIFDMYGDKVGGTHALVLAVPMLVVVFVSMMVYRRITIIESTRLRPDEKFRGSEIQLNNTSTNVLHTTLAEGDFAEAASQSN